MSKYRLLKDTPFHKAGDVFIKNDYGYEQADIKDNKGTIAVYPERLLIPSPDEWFEEIQEPKWTDQDMIRFLYTTSSFSIEGATQELILFKSTYKQL